MRRPRGDNRKWVPYASRLVRSRWHEAHGYLLHSFCAAIKRSIKLDPSLFTNFSNAHESRRHLTPPLSVRPSLMPPPPPPSFVVAAGNHAAAAAKSFLHVRLPLIGLHTDRPSTNGSVDASIRLGYLQRMIRIIARVKINVICAGVIAVSTIKLSRFVLQISEDSRTEQKQNRVGLLRISQRHRLRVGIRVRYRFQLIHHE